jgi:hypothetical protein
LIDAAHAPLWLVVLAAAALAPFCVAAMQRALETKQRRATAAVLARAGGERRSAASTPKHDTEGT